MLQSCEYDDQYYVGKRTDYVIYLSRAKNLQFWDIKNCQNDYMIMQTTQGN